MPFVWMTFSRQHLFSWHLSIKPISKLLLTQFWPNFKVSFLGPSLADVKCHGEICSGIIWLGDICPYQQNLRCYWTNFDQTFPAQKIFWTQFFSRPKINLDPNFFKSKIILDQNFFAPNFIEPNIFSTKRFLNLKFDGPKKIWTEMFLDQKIFSSKFFWPTFFLTKILLTKNGFLTKISYQQILVCLRLVWFGMVSLGLILIFNT